MLFSFVQMRGFCISVHSSWPDSHFSCQAVKHFAEAQICNALIPQRKVTPEGLCHSLPTDEVSLKSNTRWMLFINQATTPETIKRASSSLTNGGLIRSVWTVLPTETGNSVKSKDENFRFSTWFQIAQGNTWVCVWFMRLYLVLC